MQEQRDNSPLITIITVVYNAVQTLENTIKSVLDQSYLNIQYIIVDGASTDGTHLILDKYRDKLAKVISEQDSGIYDAMNKGLTHATGDWVYFLGADDILATTDVIQEAVSRFQNPAKIYYGDTFLKNSNRVYQGEVNARKFFLCNISHQAIFYPQTVYRSNRYDLKYKYFADHIHNLEIYAADKNTYEYIPVLVSIYNDLGRSSTSIDHQYNKDIVSFIFRKFGVTAGAYVWTRRMISSLKNI
ncbi:glycosyltransferase family 2 protein [Dyadobacter sp. CY347]|uniref:glycosyltransferase family 2 protein n=1 Tax=Dyadobacter sp. CY347 TaxID=2909336 RepID=UPI001F23FC5B|nr:glycosyltransferase family 2 protein [Dyadobacter sp. CY347]MCF2491098.1 glycosyltransferase [Dyadobacter sp. CY347]